MQIIDWTRQKDCDLRQIFRKLEQVSQARKVLASGHPLGYYFHSSSSISSPSDNEGLEDWSGVVQETLRLSPFLMLSRLLWPPRLSPFRVISHLFWLSSEHGEWGELGPGSFTIWFRAWTSKGIRKALSRFHALSRPVSDCLRPLNSSWSLRDQKAVKLRTVRGSGLFSLHGLSPIEKVTERSREGQRKT